MSLRTYTVYLQGGASLNLKASGFEVLETGVVFYDAEGKPLLDTYIDPLAVIAVVPPTPPSQGLSGTFLSS